MTDMVIMSAISIYSRWQRESSDNCALSTFWLGWEEMSSWQ